MLNNWGSYFIYGTGYIPNGLNLYSTFYFDFSQISSHTYKTNILLIWSLAHSWIVQRRKYLIFIVICPMEYIWLIRIVSLNIFKQSVEFP